MSVPEIFLLTGVILILVGGFMGDDDFLREVAIGICAACLLMLVGACLAFLFVRYVPSFFMLITHGHHVHEFI